MKPFLFAILAALALSLPAWAGPVEDAIKLVKAGLSEEVIVSWASEQANVSLSGHDIIRMHEAKVPDKAIMALVRPAKAEKEPVEKVVIRAAEPERVVRVVEEAAPIQVAYSYPYYPFYCYSYPFLSCRPYGGYVAYPSRYHAGMSVGFSFGHGRR